MTENTNASESTEPQVATAAQVRAAFKAGKFTLPEGVSTASLLGKDGTGEKVRGRIHPAAMDAFLASRAGRGLVRPYLGNTDADGNPVERATKAPTLVTVPRVNSKGRSLAPTVLSRTEILALAGEPTNKRGALSQKVLAAAGAAHVASGAKVVKPSA
jgi:hypothetical protein